MARKNLKIKTATSRKDRMFLGVLYKSKLEKIMAMCLHEQNLPINYETKKIVLFDKIDSSIESYKRSANGKGNFKNRMFTKVSAITYTPDFVDSEAHFDKEGSFIIETKGYPTPVFNLRYKLFERYCTMNYKNVRLFMPRTSNDCYETAKLIKDRYVY